MNIITWAKEQILTYRRKPTQLNHTAINLVLDSLTHTLAAQNLLLKTWNHAERHEERKIIAQAIRKLVDVDNDQIKSAYEILIHITPKKNMPTP